MFLFKFNFINKDSFISFILILIFIFGIFIRAYAFIVSDSLWHDECSLALNIWDLNINDYFYPLKHWQCSPPIFMIITKLITNIFNINEHSLRLFPFLCSIASIPAFYFLSKQVLKNKLLIFFYFHLITT